MAGVRDRAHAQAREKAAAMPSPVMAARRGITAAQYMDLPKQQAALMVIRAAQAAAGIAYMAGCSDVRWLDDIQAEATRIYVATVQKTLPGGTPWDDRGRLKDLDCPECGIPWAQPSADCPRIAYNLHRLANAR